MLLPELYKLGVNIVDSSSEPLKTPRYAMTLKRKIDIVLTISEDGDFLGMDNLNCELCVLSAATRGTNIKSNFLYDTADYVLGFSKPSKELDKNLDKKHKSFIDAHQKAFNETNNSNLKSVLLFYEKSGKEKFKNEIEEKIKEFAEKKSDPKIGFRIKKGNDYVFLHEDIDLIEYYCETTKHENELSCEKYGSCSITGKDNQPLISTTHRKVYGFPSPAPATGTALYCNNFFSVTNKKDEQLLGSNISIEADKFIPIAMEYLLTSQENQLKVKNSGIVFLYWLDNCLESFDLDRYLNETQIDEIDKFLKSFIKNESSISNLVDADCHMIEVNCNTQRPHLKYKKFKNSELYENLSFWYDSIKIDNSYFSIYKIDESLKLKSKLSFYEELVRCAVFGKMPSTLLINRINKINYSHRGAYETKERKYLSKSLVALINFILNKHDMKNNNNPYIIGQMLALTDELQQKALPGVNDKFSSNNYNSNNVSLLFNKMDKKIRLYINMLKKEQSKAGLGFYYEKKYNEMVANLDITSFEKNFYVFSPIEQIRKSKGFSDFLLKIDLNEESKGEKNV